ncbi:histidine phosphatase family protein [Mycolicibacterium celeriflavum]|nr:histidine phosphatase family protein [Mycolicibacterium celeriflavum]ORA43826.1 hypothetical protein BST21_21060 [Mycolicibacterium celeriflavum]
MWRLLGITMTALALLAAAAIPAAAAELMRVTFVRHGESAGNASGLIDTSTPGPILTAKGQQQAQAVVGTLGVNNYDAIYSSTMVRTQLTAGPMSQYLRLPIQVLPGLQEIEAGIFEGTPEADAANGYARFPLAWAFQGNRDLRIPGSINGHEFDARVDGALETIYDNGDRNPVVFSHGGTIMFWTMMNVQNLTLEQKIELLRTAHLDNTDYVVVEGNPEDGWTLVNWNGQQFAPEPTLAAEVQLQTRTLTRQLAAATQEVLNAFATGNVATIVGAIGRAIDNAAYSIGKYTRAVAAKIADDLNNLVTPPAPAPSEGAEVTSTTDVSASADTMDAATTARTMSPSGEADASDEVGDTDRATSAASNRQAAETPAAAQLAEVSAAEKTSEEEGGTGNVTQSDGETDLTARQSDASTEDGSHESETSEKDAGDTGTEADSDTSDTKSGTSSTRSDANTSTTKSGTSTTRSGTSTTKSGTSSTKSGTATSSTKSGTATSSTKSGTKAGTANGGGAGSGDDDGGQQSDAA